MQTAVVPPEGDPGIEKRALDFLLEDFLKYGIQSKRGERISLRRTYAFLNEDAAAVEIRPIGKYSGGGATGEQQFFFLSGLRERK